MEKWTWKNFFSLYIGCTEETARWIGRLTSSRYRSLIPVSHWIFTVTVQSWSWTRRMTWHATAGPRPAYRGRNRAIYERDNPLNPTSVNSRWLARARARSVEKRRRCAMCSRTYLSTGNLALLRGFLVRFSAGAQLENGAMSSSIFNADSRR